VSEPGWQEVVVLNYIKFSKCPVGAHKGTRWEKLDRVNKSNPLKLASVEVYTDSQLTQDEMQQDTFWDFTWVDWSLLLQKFYGFDEVALLKLLFRQGDVTITTFRAYTWQKHKYYLSLLGSEFVIQETD
jgi:hypothetical protein